MPNLDLSGFCAQLFVKSDTEREGEIVRIDIDLGLQLALEAGHSGRNLVQLVS